MNGKSRATYKTHRRAHMKHFERDLQSSVLLHCSLVITQWLADRKFLLLSKPVNSKANTRLELLIKSGSSITVISDLDFDMIILILFLIHSHLPIKYSNSSELMISSNFVSVVKFVNISLLLLPTLLMNLLNSNHPTPDR